VERRKEGGERDAKKQTYRRTQRHKGIERKNKL
jgi:hypothetical protein